MRAAMYLRQSRDREKNQLAISRQRKDCLKLCKAHGWEPVEYVDNDTSASGTKVRKDYRRMLADIRAGQIQAVVCWDLDRLHRRPVELEEFIDLADQHKLALATVTGEVDLSTDNGRLYARIKGAVGRSEVERKSARQKAANLQAAEKGKPPQRQAFGWTEDGMELVSAEAAAVRTLYAKVLAGTTLVAATNWLNEQGFRTTRGGEWKRSNVRWLLLNPRYAGIRLYDGVEMGRGTWPAIIDDDTHRAMQALLSDPKRKMNQGTARRWLGAGLYLCGRCGSDVRVNYRDDGNRIYRCRKSAHLSRLADPVDKFVSEVIAARLRRPDAADLLAVEDGAESKELRDQAIGIRSRLDAVAADYADGLLTARQVKVATKRLEDRLTDIEKRQAVRGQRNALAAVLAARSPAQAWLDAELGTQREVISILCEQIVLERGVRGRFDPDTVVITPR